MDAFAGTLQYQLDSLFILSSYEYDHFLEISREFNRCQINLWISH